MVIGTYMCVVDFPVLCKGWCGNSLLCTISVSSERILVSPVTWGGWEVSEEGPQCLLFLLPFNYSCFLIILHLCPHIKLDAKGSEKCLLHLTTWKTLVTLQLLDLICDVSSLPLRFTWSRSACFVSFPLTPTPVYNLLSITVRLSLTYLY